MTSGQIDRLVAALRDPARRQTTGKLHGVGGTQCCLDVICELEGLPLVMLGDRYIRIDLAWETNASTSSQVLPEALRKRLGLEPGTFILPVADRDEQYLTAATLNDAGFSFRQIADVFEYFRDEIVAKSEEAAARQ